MIRAGLFISAFIGSLPICGMAAAQSYDAFAFDTAKTAAERLVLCDTTLFLSQRPDLHALRIEAPRSDGSAALLLPPLFVTGGQLYSDRYERLAQKLLSAHELTIREVVVAQATIAKAMIDLYRPTRYVDHPFTVRQERACRAFAREHGVRGGF